MVALIAAPLLGDWIGVPVIFVLMFALALAAIALLHFAVPAEPERGGGAEGRDLPAMLEILRRPQLRPLYLGIFALHFIMTATFISVPQALEGGLGVPVGEHWKMYLAVFVVSVAGTVPLVLRVYATAQFLGAFSGGVGGGLLLGRFGIAGLF